MLQPRSARDEVPQPTQRARADDAELLEREFGPFEVPLSTASGFTHFLDDAQKSWPILADEYRIAYLAHTSAALMARVDRRIEPPAEGFYAGSLEAFLPEGFREVDQIERAVPIRTVNLSDSGAASSVQSVYDAIRQRRQAIERDVAQRYRPGPNDFLLVDGSLAKARRSDGTYPDVAGVVKTHSRQYVSREDRVRAVMSMPAGWRSGAFVVTDRRNGNTTAMSFYLRLRTDPTSGPLYGLVRVELPPEAAWLDRIDEIAGWILAERTPLSLPDPRFDRLVYPIRAVEMFLHARQPSDAAVRSVAGI